MSGLTGPARAGRVLWLCAALSDADRLAAQQAPEGRLDQGGHDLDGLAVRMLPIEPLTFNRAYNAIANSTLWFLHHLLYAPAVSPVFDAGFRQQWASYEAYSREFAEALAAAAGRGARVLVQDYHLSLVPGLLRELRPDLRISHFSHTPWAPPEYLRLLPDDIARQVLTGILGADCAGFLSGRWAEAFVGCCTELLETPVDRAAGDGRMGIVGPGGRRTRVGVHPLGVDAAGLRQRAHGADVEVRRTLLLDEAGGRRLIVRVDRTELSKNIVRGLLAYRELLRRRPEWRGEVVHVAFAYPSRHDLPEYREYTAAVQRLATEIDEEFGSPSWRPLLLHVNDDYPRSLAAYRLADVLLVNPVRDGMNLVAKEGPVLAERGCALVLSTEAGAAAELGAEALLVNPFDVSATAEALHAALSMPEEERRARCARLAEAAAALPPQQWFTDQVAALDALALEVPT